MYCLLHWKTKSLVSELFFSFQRSNIDVSSCVGILLSPRFRNWLYIQEILWVLVCLHFPCSKTRVQFCPLVLSHLHLLNMKTVERRVTVDDLTFCWVSFVVNRSKNIYIQMGITLVGTKQKQNKEEKSVQKKRHCQQDYFTKSTQKLKIVKKQKVEVPYEDFYARPSPGRP